MDIMLILLLLAPVATVCSGGGAKYMGAGRCGVWGVILGVDIGEGT